MKRGKFEPGDVLEITRDGKYAYCRALRRDHFGMIFEILAGVFEHPVELRDVIDNPRRAVAYINEYSAKKAWKYIGALAFSENAEKIPPVFNGHPDYFWTVYKDEGEQVISAKDVSYLELRKKGYLERILWLAPKIEDYVFDEKPLIWQWK